MINRRNTFVLVSLMIAGVVTALSLSQSPAAQEKEVSYPIKLEVDPTCKPKQPSELILKERIKETEYQFHVINSYTYAITKHSLGSCEVLNETGNLVRFSGSVPDELVSAFAEAFWTYRAKEAGGKSELEKVLASTPLVYGLNAEVLFSEDLAAMKELEIEYPDYVRPHDSFSSYDEMAAYYDKIYTPEWFEKHPDPAD